VVCKAVVVVFFAESGRAMRTATPQRAWRRRPVALTAGEEVQLARAAHEERRARRVRAELCEELGRAPTPSEWATAVFPGEDDASVERLVATRAAAVRAQNALVEANAGLVKSIAARYGGGERREDLVQEGTLGLIHAIDKFDPNKGFRLSTYATRWIRVAMLDWVRRNRGAFPVPQRALTVDRKATDLSRQLEETLGREPTRAELADGLGVSLDYLERSREAVSLATEVVALEPYDLPLSADTQDDDLRADLFRALETHLNDKQLRVIRLRYGLDDGLPRSTRDVAVILGISKENVRVTCLNAFRTLRGTDLGNALLAYMD